MNSAFPLPPQHQVYLGATFSLFKWIKENVPFRVSYWHYL